MNGRNAVVMARRNQVSADEAVRAGAADEKRASQHPERGGLNSHAQRGYRGERSPCFFGLNARLLPVSEQAQIGGPIPHENQDDHENQDGRRRDDHRRAAPPVPFDLTREHREEDELPGRVGRGERAHHQPSAFVEPSSCDDGREHHRRDAGATANEHAPQQRELPPGMHQRARGHGNRQQPEGQQDHAPQPPAVHHRGRKGSNEPEERDVDRDRARDHRSIPAELCLERHHQHARRCADPRGDEENHERHHGDDPRVVQPRHGRIGAGCRHFYSDCDVRRGS